MKRAYFPSIIILAAILLAVPVMAEDLIPADAKVKNAECPVQKISNDAFEVSLWPVRQEPGLDWVAFRLTVRNKTATPLSLVWDDTYYMHSDKKDGRFKFENEAFSNKGQLRPMEVIPAGATFSRVIWPESRFFNGGQATGWIVLPIANGEGQHGVLLALKSGDTEYQEKISLNIDNQVQTCKLSPKFQFRR